MICSTLEELKKYVSKYENAEGYCKDLSDRGFEIFKGKITLSDFPYEAAFTDGNKSVSVRFIDGRWYIDETEIDYSLIDETKDVSSFYIKAEEKKKAKFIQIWEEEEDEFCEGMKVLKLKKVVFAGFEGVEND